MLRRSARAGRALVLRRQRSDARDSLLSFHESVAASLNTTARLLGVPHRIRVDASPHLADAAKGVGDGGGGGGAAAAGGGDAAPAFEKGRLSSALRYMTEEDIEAYCGELVGSGQLGDFEGLPSQLQSAEKFVYGHCVKILLCVMHDGIDALPDLRVLGLRVDAAPAARPKLDLLGALRRRLARDDVVVVDVLRVSEFVDRVIEVEREFANGGEAAPVGRVERVLHDNVCALVINLLADACSTFRLDCFGHSLKIDVSPNDMLARLDLEALRERRRRRADRAPLFDETHVALLVEEILSDEKINLAFVPDIVEAQFYTRVFAFYGKILDYVLRDVHLSVLDVDLALSLERD